MKLRGTEFIVDAEFSEFCSVFESETNAHLVLDSSANILYMNHLGVKSFSQESKTLTSLNTIFPKIELEFVRFLSSNLVLDKQRIAKDVEIEWRRFNYKETPLVLVSLKGFAPLKEAKFTINHLISNDDSNHFFKEIIDRSIAGIIGLRKENFEIVSMNARAQQILGLTQQQLSEEPMKLFKNAFSQKRFMIFFNGVLKKGADQFNFQIDREHGFKTFIKVGAYSIYDAKSDFVVLGFMDTTDSVKRKLDYQQQSLKLKAFVENNVLPLAMFDTEMNYMLVDRKWLEIYAADNVEDLVGKNYYECHPNVPQRWRLAHMKAMSGTTVSNLKDHHVLPNGREEWFKWLAKPWYKGKDVIGGIIVYAEKITSEIEANILAKNQEIRYKRFFENSSIGWLEIDCRNFVSYCYNTTPKKFKLASALKFFEQSKVINFNDQLREIFGLSFADENFNPAHFLKEGLKNFLFKFIHSLQNEQEIFEHEISLVNALGEEKSLFISARLPEDEDISNIVFGVLDITDLKSSVSELRESEERYRTIFDSNSFGVIYTNDKKSIVRVNPAFTKMLGYTEKEMQQLDEIDLLYPKYRQEARSQIEAFKSGNLRQIKAEREYKRKNNKRLIASTDTSALYDHEGKYYGMVKIIEDISERKLDEQRIKNQNKELLKINEELDKFVYSAAHDLRAPIANVLGLVKLLKFENLGSTAMEYVNLQEKSLEKLDEFIMSIVDYSRNSRTSISLENIDFKAYIEQILARHRHVSNADRIKFTLNVKQTVDFAIDQHRLDIVFNNLISNAIKYADMSKANPAIDITVKANIKTATIVIKDNGIGIDAKHMTAIFDLFYRASSDSKGTGIGLYLVKEAVAKLKGSITVESELTVGTTFKLQLKNCNDLMRKNK